MVLKFLAKFSKTSLRDSQNERTAVFSWILGSSGKYIDIICTTKWINVY